MRKVIANEWMTLDGVVQAPSYADDGALRSLRLADSMVTSTGAIIATYAAAGG
jgi:roadblock/LC7 domain-containing protein